MASENFALLMWGSGLASFAYAVLAWTQLARGYVRRPREAAQVALLAVTIGCAVWGGLVCAYAASRNLLWIGLSGFADILRYGAWLAFLLILLRVRRVDEGARLMRWLAPVSALCVLAAAGIHTLMLLGIGDSVWVRRTALSLFMSLPVVVVVVLEQLFRNASEDSRWNIKPLCLGLAGACLFDIYMYSEGVLFNRLDSDAFSIRGVVHASVVPFLVMSTSRNTDWLAKVHVSRKAAFHSATLMMAGLYLLFISGVGYYVRYFGGEWGRALQLGLVFLGAVLLVALSVSGTMRAALRVFLGKHFFRYRYDYREEWLRFTQTLSGRDSAQDMGERVVRGLADLLESPGGGLWLRNRGEGAYLQTARWNMPRLEVSVEPDTVLCQFLRDSGWVVNLEEFRSFPRRYGRLVLPPWVSELPQAWLVVPLMVGDDMIGFVILVRARARLDVNWEVNDLLKTAGRQAASFLAQMQATEALLEVRKFDAFNRMSAFVVHDLKNIVTQLSLMMKNAKRLRDNPEFQQDMLLTVENSLDRMRQLMLQLREGATPPGTSVGVELEPMVRRLARTAVERGRHLYLDVIEPVATRGHEERLERILGHIVQNAFDATDPSGRVWLKLERVRGQAVIEVGDTGRGMTEEFMRERLFKPFQSTKQAGMGIGAYESFQYVQELGGKIQVNSQVNRGTVITVQLPVFEMQRMSDLQPLGAS